MFGAHEPTSTLSIAFQATNQCSSSAKSGNFPRPAKDVKYTNIDGSDDIFKKASKSLTFEHYPGVGAGFPLLRGVGFWD